MWTESGGTVDFNGCFAGLGISTGGVTLTAIQDMSDDGSILVGFGMMGDERVGWVVSGLPGVPGPGTGLAVLLGAAGVGMRRRVRG